jgi:hypothetical protein
MLKSQATLVPVGLQVNLNRFDLFHAHMFLAAGGLGLLFHAAEYPQRGPDFPIDLGFCQRASSLPYSEEGMNWRNLLYYSVFR